MLLFWIFLWYSLNVKMCLRLKLYTVPFFVSGQTYKISKGSNNYFSHCMLAGGKKLKNHSTIIWCFLWKCLSRVSVFSLFSSKWNACSVGFKSSNRLGHTLARMSLSTTRQNLCTQSSHIPSYFTDEGDASDNGLFHSELHTFGFRLFWYCIFCNHLSIKHGSRTFLASLCFFIFLSKFKSGLLILAPDEWFSQCSLCNSALEAFSVYIWLGIFSVQPSGNYWWCHWPFFKHFLYCSKDPSVIKCSLAWATLVFSPPVISFFLETFQTSLPDITSFCTVLIN